MGNKTVLPAYDFLKKLDSSVSFEYTRLEKAYNSYDARDAHRHNYFEILAFNDAGGTHEIDFVSYDVERNSIHFIAPGQVHRLKRHPAVKGHVLAFTEEIIALGPTPGIPDLLFSDPESGHVMRLEEATFQTIEQIIHSLNLEYKGENPFKKQAIITRLSLLFIELLRLKDMRVEASATNPGRQLYSKFRKLVEERFMKHLPISSYAEELNISSGHLNDTIKKICGKSVREVIQQRMILEARRMLYHSTHSVKEIAFMLHYDDPSYFIRFFRQHSGETPQEFRDRQ